MDDRTPPERKKRPTLKDVARLAGVHVSTVSRTLDPNADHLIRDEVKEKIRAVCRELNYRPNSIASSLRTNRTKTIGVVIPDITNLLFPPIFRGIEDELAAQGYAAIMVNTDGDADREEQLTETLIARGVDGIIAASVPRQDAHIARMAQRGFPIVTVNRRLDDPSVPSVTNDDDFGIKRILTHLVALGHRRIVHIAGPQSLSTGKLRAEAFARYHAEILEQAEPPVIVYAESFNEAEGERCAEQILAKGTPVTAALCANDRLAIGAIAAFKRRGLKVPEDISVTGFNDMALVDRIDPPLTTIRIQHYEIGRNAARMILAMIENGTLPPDGHKVLPVELVVRQSSGPAPRP
ncbi:LacI family DNA-binding transcriptional regulator [Polymorphum gilvum]|uniref:Catabolite control protein A (Glucose-resistance amylase regulator) n=1 Tax=Polymorphum gilvum (strain LMG 25793 / CGMCC 1.9160 / SL003B-26A1) TaxID=991905 RepID=F2IYL4_POLGS|nr:LacI family DNA-binding transcriptional regulator [Polymorphum gilvum]ADZ69461.1 Catabolite control protein A (Glucose-resistance amylase regulator) [Polymorphum gilvum SL003B-26A1]